MTDTATTPSAPPAPSAIEPVSFALYDGDFEAFSRALGESFRRYGFALRFCIRAITRCQCQHPHPMGSE